MKKTTGLGNLATSAALAAVLALDGHAASSELPFVPFHTTGRGTTLTRTSQPGDYPRNPQYERAREMQILSVIQNANGKLNELK